MQNTQQKLDTYLEGLGTRRPRLLLHACCAPCSTWPLQYLSKYFDITLFFYNPNMDSQEEYERRASELTKLLDEMKPEGNVQAIIAPYEHEAFEEMARGLEEEPERGKRCLKCYELRLRKTAEYMKAAAAKAAGEAAGFDWFATTLTLSPLKNASAINEIGRKLSLENETAYLETDFKKKNGYLNSLALSKQYNLYRQNYCGCKYSKRGEKS